MSRIGRQRYRSFLFVPGNRPERYLKAWESNADVVIIDLEDAVPIGEKDPAREAVANWVGPERPVLIRVNGLATPWFEQDVRVARLPGVDGVVLPKAANASDVATLLSRIERDIPIYPLIESAQGMWNVLEIATAPGVRQLMFGTLDFCADMGMALTSDTLSPYRADIVMASRVAGIRPPLDGVTPGIDDDKLLQTEAAEGKKWGFAGKLCIHPCQAPVVNRCYAPSKTELAWARRVLDAFERANGAAVAVDGKMVDRPVILQARRILDEDESEA